MIAPTITLVVAFMKRTFWSRLMPMITDARPMTTIPGPICRLAVWVFCAIAAPATAAKPLPSARPMILEVPGLRASMVTNCSLLPVARSSMPDRVEKYQSSSSLDTTESTITRISARSA